MLTHSTSRILVTKYTFSNLLTTQSYLYCYFSDILHHTYPTPQLSSLVPLLALPLSLSVSYWTLLTHLLYFPFQLQQCQPLSLPLHLTVLQSTQSISSELLPIQSTLFLHSFPFFIFRCSFLIVCNSFQNIILFS